MIDKVIIAEDHESGNLSVQKTMEDLQIIKTEHVFYCDDALNKIKLAQKAGDPYDVLITDLYFEDDGTSQILKNGFELIKAARLVQPGIMVLVFSAENKPLKIKSLYNDYRIDGFVRKARQDVKELKAAFETLSKGEQYYSIEIAQLIKKSKAYEFTDFDVDILSLVLKGKSQKEIATLLERHPSTIEKTLKKMRDEFGFTKNEQLVARCKDVGLL